MSKTIVLMLFTLLSLSGLVMVGFAFAQSIPRPSVPEFTVEYVDYSYDVPPKTTSTTDLYTNKTTTTTFPGHRVSNYSIEVTIKNQPFDYSVNGLTYHLYYNVRTKPHFAENWTELYPLVDRLRYRDSRIKSKYVSDESPHASNSNFTVLSFSTSNYPDDAQVDFQVQTIVGHYSQVFVLDYAFLPIRGHYETAVAFDVAGDWSSTQTVILTISTPTPSPEPTISLEPILFLGVIAIVAVFTFGLFMLYRIKRK